MKITRIVALGVIAASIGGSVAQAQQLRTAGPPAEYPPATYKGSQYVDSRGCVYIRAGIDGNVTWVPRVSRARQQLCGYKPTAVAGASPRPAGNPPPEIITLEASPQPAAKPAETGAPSAKPAPEPAPAPKAAAAPASTPSATAQPQPAPAAPAPQQAAAVPAPAPAPAAVPRKLSPAPAPVPAAAPAQPACPGASEISQRYTNQTGVRCGPQAQSPVTYSDDSGIGPQSSLRLTPNTRVVPVHVYQDRRHSQGLSTPAGYRTVWQDDRLNLRRAERSLKPAVVTSRAEVPPGYVRVARDDDRLNPMRGVRTAEGDAQMARIWTDGTPRELTRLPLDRPVVRLAPEDARSFAEAEEPLVMRLSTRSAPEAAAEPAPRRYVRAATYRDAAEAKAAARTLAAQGLPVRMGRLTRGGTAYSVVLAGPFTGDARAQSALAKAQAAGFTGARLSK